MTHTLAYLIGSLVTGLAWAAHYYWREYQHSVEVLREKERSYQAGYAHAKNLICFKPRAGVETPNPPTKSSALRQVLR